MTVLNGIPSSHVAPALLAWYDAHRRDLPWRAPPGAPADPYHVWLSEIMLQQTTVAAVKSYFETFKARWPTVFDLATAPADAVMAAWAGLGYYARARNMHACAKAVAADFDGCFPTDEAALRRLPGIGAYTAAAIAAIAFDKPAVVVDGNVERVVARLFALSTPLPKAKPLIRERAAELSPDDRSGDYAQAMMDLGATICTPRSPSCQQCPVSDVCAARQCADPTAFPIKAPKKVKPHRQGTIYWLQRGESVFLVRRPPQGLLGGMLALPSSEWHSDSRTVTAQDGAPADLPWTNLPGQVRHVFTHFTLDISLRWAACGPQHPVVQGEWCAIRHIDQVGLPTVFAKAARHAIAALQKKDP